MSTRRPRHWCNSRVGTERLSSSMTTTANFATRAVPWKRAGHLTRHVRKMRDIYKRRRQLLRESLQDKLGDWLKPIPSFYGMHVAATLTASVDLERVTDELLEHNVKIHTLSRYFLGPQSRAGRDWYSAMEPWICPIFAVAFPRCAESCSASRPRHSPSEPCRNYMPLRPSCSTV
jgi:hypothetical protein